MSHITHIFYINDARHIYVTWHIHICDVYCLNMRMMWDIQHIYMRAAQNIYACSPKYICVQPKSCHDLISHHAYHLYRWYTSRITHVGHVKIDTRHVYDMCHVAFTLQLHIMRIYINKIQTIHVTSVNASRHRFAWAHVTHMNASRHRFAFAMATFGLRASLVTLPEGMAENDWYTYNVYILCVQLCVHIQCVHILCVQLCIHNMYLYILWAACLSRHIAWGYGRESLVHIQCVHTLRAMYVYIICMYTLLHALHAIYVYISCMYTYKVCIHILHAKYLYVHVEHIFVVFIQSMCLYNLYMHTYFTCHIYIYTPCTNTYLACHIYIHIPCTYTYSARHVCIQSMYVSILCVPYIYTYGVATISRLLEIISLFCCRISSLL